MFYGTNGFVKSPDGSWTDTIKKFETDQENFLYDIEPQANNLFIAAKFRVSSGAKLNANGDEDLNFTNAHFRIRSIELPERTVELEADKLTRLPVIKNVGYNPEIKISWFEDAYHTVRSYHERWLDSWMNERYNIFVCGPEGKFRSCEVLMYHYKKTGDFLNPKLEVEPIAVINLYGLVPKGIPGMKLSYEDDDGANLLTMSYICGKYEIIYNSAASWNPTILSSKLNEAETSTEKSIEENSRLLATKGPDSFTYCENKK